MAIEHVWPELRFGWRSVVGTLTGFIGAAVGSAGGVGGGSIFVPTADLILGFDTKSATALSKCMIMGAAFATFGYNLRLKHPQNRSIPLIDYDMALLLQPMLLLGISVGVIFNTVFPTWVLTLVLISVLIGTGLRVWKKALQAWHRETSEKEKRLLFSVRVAGGKEEPGYKAHTQTETLDDEAGSSSPTESKYSVLDTLKKNVNWVNVGVLLLVWGLFVVLQVLQSHSRSCSAQFWILNSLQLPVALLAFSVAALKLRRKAKRQNTESLLGLDESGVTQVGFKLLAVTAMGSLVAGMLAGLIGLGGGFALGPLLLEYGAHPQALSATALFCMLFSSSMSVVEYYLLDRFPVPYALYLIAVSMAGGVSGQYVMDTLIKLLGRASIIIFLLTSLTILAALVLGGTGIATAIHQWKMGEYMGFLGLC